ncbi:MAG: prepilin-type N-terminal cleavage/methylation domain-containing protein [Ilumatobacteraceae bacterium]
MSCRHTARNAKGGRDGGFSLVEVVIAIVLMGTVVVAILNAVSTSVKASSVSRSAAQVETAVVNAADRVNRAPKRCDYTIYVQAAVQTEGWSPDTASVTHEYYVPGVDATVEGTWETGAAGSPGCSGPAPTDLLVQRVTISITSPDGKVRRNIEVVKSDV